MTITWTNETRRLSELIHWPRNPRQIKGKQAKRLAESVREFGQVETLAIGPSNELYNGHQRANVLAEKHGLDYEVEVRVASRELTEKEREKLTVYLHQGATGEWDFDTLANEFEVDELLEWGFDDSPMAEMLEDFSVGETNEGEDAEPQISKAEELRQEYGVELGQLWQLGEHRIICGDCTDRNVIGRLMDGQIARYGMHDPPYGINVVGVSTNIDGDKPFGKGRIGSEGVAKSNNYAPVIGDDKPFDPEHLLEASQDSVLWGANYYADKLAPQKGWLVWDKKGREGWRDNYSDCELAWSSLKVVTKIFRHTWIGMVQEGEREKRVHPTQKPVALFEKMIDELFLDEGIIIDFYLGSGTTLLACERLNRVCYAAELSADYVAVAIHRWEQHAGRTAELISTNTTV